MSAIKKSLVGNLFVLFRNGIIGTTTSFPGQGVYISYITPTGERKLLNDTDFENWDKFKPKQMNSTLDLSGEFDIIRLYRPHDPVLLLIEKVKSEKDLDNCADLVWYESPAPGQLEPDKSKNTIEFVENNPIESMTGNNSNSEIVVRTRMFITVNGKEIDPNNLTDTESSILKKLGLL